MKSVWNGNVVEDLKGDDDDYEDRIMTDCARENVVYKPRIIYHSAVSDDLRMILRTLRKKKFSSDRSNEKEHFDKMEMYTEPYLYLAAINGPLGWFKTILNGIPKTEPETDILSMLTPLQNTFLHVAAKHGNHDIVKFIANAKPSLVLAKNFNGETALHLAAKGGDEAMVRALVGDLSLNETEKHNLLIAENKMGDTALHQALLSGCESIASFLIQQDSELSYHLNKHGESAIYLAAEAGFVECVSSILTMCTDQSRLSKLFEEDSSIEALRKGNKSPIQAPRKKKKKKNKSQFQAQSKKNESQIQAPRKVNKSPFQAAIERKEIVVLKALISKKRDLIKMRDNEGRNPLHFAASLGHLEATRYLLNEYSRNATRRDKKGELPIHLAALEGHVDVIRVLLGDFLEAEELLDKYGNNILHTAARSGRYNVFRFVLNNPKLNSLINMKNIFGDTPLHIATRNDHAKIVSALTWDQRVDIKAVNNKEMTALDVAYEERTDNPSFTKRLTWAALKSASVPQNSDSGRMVNVNLGVYKERVNTLLIMATLVATVSFAAGFTMPGGYISSETGTDLGMATMWRETVFHVFVLCDTIAMYTSILVVTALIWAQLGDTTLVIYALELAAPLLGVALVMMSVAFTAGVTIVVTKLRWLQITLLAISTSFIALLLLLLLPLCAPLTSRSRILRYLSYYPFCLLVFVTSTKPNH